ncbi:hypothetical protein PVAP13_5NG540900 [Panicum virgatum]|uniref:Uncharacterized protein n=1 Tax=Panicum virgatum TaxID=38727 RepID=A0A8T0S069_PANVG|nr:hypothetical protein PVAP13_5NG540900 [Panicum virgatum]
MGDPHARAHQPRPAGVPPLLRRHPQAQRLRRAEPAAVARLPARRLHRHLRARVPLPDARAQGRRPTDLQAHPPHPGLVGAVPPPPPRRPGHHHRLLHRRQRALEAPPAQPAQPGWPRRVRLHQVAPRRRHACKIRGALEALGGTPASKLRGHGGYLLIRYIHNMVRLQIYMKEI